MRKFNDVYSDKLTESIKCKEERISNEYHEILEALMEDKKITRICYLSEEESKSFHHMVDECFNKQEGITPKGRKYLQNRELFLTENSTNKEREEFLKERIYKVVESKMYTESLKSGIYSAINELYEGVNASSLHNALPLNTIESCICECVVKHISNTLIKEFRQEIITD